MVISTNIYKVPTQSHFTKDSKYAFPPIIKFSAVLLNEENGPILTFPFLYLLEMTIMLECAPRN